MRALHLEPDRYDPGTRARLESVAEVDYVPCHDQGELLEVVRSAPYEILLVKIGLRIDAGVLEAAPRLRYVLTPTTGLDHIDEEAAAARDGITPDELAAKTAETWRNGLARSGIEPERIGRLRQGTLLNPLAPRFDRQFPEIWIFPLHRGSEPRRAHLVHLFCFVINRAQNYNVLLSPELHKTARKQGRTRPQAGCPTKAGRL